ncbi:MAG: IS66 family insertion sequence element accessory protein TnpA, partial [Haliscomenobacter sp.]
KQRTSEEMEQVMREYTQSGESVREFCLRVGIAEHLLRYWMKRLEKRDVGFSADETMILPQLLGQLKIGFII